MKRGGWRAAAMAAGLAWAAAGRAAEAGAPPPGAGGGVRLLPEVSGMGSLSWYGGSKDELQKARYVNEGILELDFALARFGEEWTLRGRFGMVAEMGKSISQHLPFSPKEMEYEVSPYVEWRRGGWMARGGWSHVCQHLVYKEQDEPWYELEGSNVPPDVYWNRLYAGFGREESRPELLRKAAFGEGRGEIPRFTWWAEAGGYLRSLPGVDDETLYSQNDWAADLVADLRAIPYAGRKWLLAGTARTHLLFDDGGEAFLRQGRGGEATFDGSGFGATVFLGGHVVDEHPRDDKDGLLEAGARLFF